VVAEKGWMVFGIHKNVTTRTTLAEHLKTITPEVVMRSSLAIYPSIKLGGVCATPIIFMILLAKSISLGPHSFHNWVSRISMKHQ
jgi:hypothetical protein